MTLGGWNQIILYPLLGSLGAIISGALILFALVPLVEGTDSGLLLPFFLEGLCFIPMGFCLGWSVSNYLKLPKTKMRTLGGICAVGGFFYGAFSFFSIGGAIIGFMLLAASAGMAIYAVSGSGRQAAAAIGSVALVLFLLFLLPNYSEQASIPVYSLLDPFRSRLAIGASGIIYIGAVGYFMNFLLLALLFFLSRPSFR